jgi:hypothetical protein
VTKTILALSIATVLVTGLLSLSSLALAAEPGDEYLIKTKRGELCEVSSTDNCGIVKSEGRLRVLSANQGIENGDGKFKIELKGILCQNELDRCRISSENVQWTLDKNTGTFSILDDPTTIWTYQDGDDPFTFKVEISGSNYQEKNKKRDTIELKLITDDLANEIKFQQTTIASWGPA